jgi:phosphoribosylformylglycinamidine synthase
VSDTPLPVDDLNVQTFWPRLLAGPHLCSRRALYQHYDSEVKASTVLRPGEADAGVVAPLRETCAGVAVSADGNPRVSRVDPYLGGVMAVVEAVRNVVCVGGVPAAITDCLNYGNPEVPEVFHDFVEGVRGIGDACRKLGRLEAPEEPLPVVSGNVSFYNQSSRGKAIAPSPIVCCVAVVADVSRCRSLSFKRAGNHLVRVGAFSAALGGSLLAHEIDPTWRGAIADVDYEALGAELRLVLQAHREGWATAVHDVSEGGMLAAVTEMALGPEGRGRRGAKLDLASLAVGHADAAVLFAEHGGFLVEVEREQLAAFQAAAATHRAATEVLGMVLDEPLLRIEGLQRSVEWTLAELAAAREQPMERLLARDVPVTPGERA